MSSIYVISIGEPTPGQDVICADSLEEARDFVNELMEKEKEKDKFYGKYVYINEYMDVNGKFIQPEGSFAERILIE
jgi:hypothetical protein